MSQPDLFVVCKNCGSEVSPYVTECPYCGQRVRKRAPKLERDEPGADARPKERRRMPKLSRLRPAEIEGIAPDTRPVATFVLIGLSLAISLALAGGLTFAEVGGIVVPLDDEPWRYATSSFVHDSLTYQFATLVAVGVFGTLLERRFGWFAPILVFVAAGAAGMAAAVQLNLGPLGESNALYAALGANGAALGLLTAWLVDDRRAARRGDQRGNDLVGVAVIAALLLVLPLAVTEANPVAGPVGAAVGALLAPVLGLLSRRA
ncbi:MAG TPA: rhomboid family intramembrane serine protease [Thermoleophilaceae bacterium]|nr:rhomboid family intramembrane serine protease [Thermoleophilaceae bacterium]